MGRTYGITGVASGIGAALARQLKDAGHSVIGFDIVETDQNVDYFVHLDLNAPSSIQSATTGSGWALDGLCNNAGLPPRDGIEAAVLQVNFIGTRDFTQRMIQHLTPGASIVNIASRAGAGWRQNLDQILQLGAITDPAHLQDFIAREGLDATRCYNLSKEAVIAWTAALTEGLIARDLRANTISPGAVATGILDDFSRAFGDKMAHNIQRAGRAGTPDEVAATAAFLLSPDSAWIKGIDLPVDGGMGSFNMADALGLGALVAPTAGGADPMTPTDRLRAHNAEFDKTIYQLAHNAYLAVGYAASNVGMIVGDDGLIIIDTTESTKAAEIILAEFRKITDLPVRTIVYTHSHRDHISGATVFAEGQEVEIIAHTDFASDLVGADGKPGPHKALMARTARQFGIGLAQGTERINIGLGPGDRPTEGLGQGHIAPNFAVVADGTRLTRCGVEMTFIFAPGECADAVAVHIPPLDLLFSADNFYTSLPNLYAIRGTPYRDFDVWADTLAKLSGIGAATLAPGHSRPVMGPDNVRAVLSDYEAAIRFIVAKTAEGMNAGLTPDELVGYVTLPEDLRTKPHLQEFYGTTAWAMRAYFAGTLGWFDGDAATLFPLPPEEEARRMADLVGGIAPLADAAASALAQDDTQWALQLAGRVLRLDPDHSSARATRISAMRTLAEQQVNACARNYYLLSAKQEEASQ